jgi:hypothetical protein
MDEGLMDRTEWILRFVDELQRLRPHLKPKYGASRIAHAHAAQAYVTGEPDPEKAAREAHQRMGPVRQAK